MRKKSFIVIGSVLMLILGLIMFKPLQPTPIWEINAKQFNGSFKTISGNNAIINDLSYFTTFEWDTLYSFAPYTPKEVVYQNVGYQWDKINSTVSEGMNQIVFLKEGKVVCYIDGYPDKYKVFFEFGQYNGNYIKLTSADKLIFHMMITDGGIRKFDYVKEAVISAKASTPFAIFLIKEIKTGDAIKSKIEDLQLETQPVLTEKDLISYDWKEHKLELRQDFAFSMSYEKVPLEGLPFVVIVNGKRAYLGAFWTPISSLSSSIPVIMFPHIPPQNTIKIEAGYPGILNDQPDPRNNQLIYNALKSIGKIRE